MLSEKENYKRFGLLKADTIKQSEVKEKYEKSISEEWIISKLCSSAEISSKGETCRQYSL